MPHMVTPSYKGVELYIGGLEPEIEGMVTSSKPTTIQQAIRLAHTLTDQAVKRGALPKRGADMKPNDHKRKWDNNSTRSGNNNSSQQQQHHQQQQPQQQQRRTEPAKNQSPFSSNTHSPSNYLRKNPLCSKCNRHHHSGPCYQIRCLRCNKLGHQAKDCKVILTTNSPAPTNEAPKGCFGCGKPGHFNKDCPHNGGNGNGNNNNNNNGNNKSRAFVIGSGEARKDPNVVTGTFPLNDQYASILFDTGADRSFISSDFSKLLDHTPVTLEAKYTVELADGKTIGTEHILKGCKLELFGHKIDIDLIPISLGSFDVVVGMDWLAKNQAKIICQDKIVRIPLPSGETLTIHGEKSGTTLRIISCMKAHKCLRKGHSAILALIYENQSEEQRLEDIPIVQDFPEVFPEDLPGLPPLVKLNSVLILHQEQH